MRAVGHGVWRQAWGTRKVLQSGATAVLSANALSKRPRASLMSGRLEESAAEAASFQTSLVAAIVGKWIRHLMTSSLLPRRRLHERSLSEQAYDLSSRNRSLASLQAAESDSAPAVNYYCACMVHATDGRLARAHMQAIDRKPIQI